MDLFKQGMKGPARPAPPVPGVTVNRYSPVTNWDDDPFGADVFEPNPQYAQKKKPPPRPPPPKLNNKQPEVPAKPSHFIRKPTILSSLMSRKTKVTVNNHNVNHQNLLSELSGEMDTNKLFPKCEPKNVQTGALIDLSSPPSSPTFTTRSSSDGLSVDSFGSDATTSTNHQNNHNGGNASQTESGFEDDFDLFLSTRKAVSKEDTFDNFNAIDPFSTPFVSKPGLKKSALNRDPFDISSNANPSQPALSLLKGPTIIRAKPARPKPPDNSSLLKNTFGSTFPVTVMTVNTTTPIQKMNSFGDSFDSKPISWDEDDSSSPDRESSPPMPTIPPPPPPPVTEEDLPVVWPDEVPDTTDYVVNDAVLGNDLYTGEEPYAIALFDYFTDHSDDLCFSANSKIKLIRRMDDEWLFGCLKSGVQGIFPSNYVEIKVPLPNEQPPAQPMLGSAVAMYDFEPDQPGDLRFVTGDTITVRHKLNDEWYYGECNGNKGHFPINYVQMNQTR